jgi:hypothetical protein
LWKEIAACAVEHFLRFLIFCFLLTPYFAVRKLIIMSLGQVVYDDADCVELVRQVRSSGKVLCGVAIK